MSLDLRILFLLIVSLETKQSLQEQRYGDFNKYNLTIFYISDIFTMFAENRTKESSDGLDVLMKLKNLGKRSLLSSSVILLNPGNAIHTNNSARSLKEYMEFLNSFPITAGGLSYFKGYASSDSMEPVFKVTKYPILVCNLNLKGSFVKKYIKPSIILDISDKKLGVIGYISEQKKNLYPTDDGLNFVEESSAISKECLKLRFLEVAVVIAMGFSDFTTDLRIAETVECVDVVIGSDSKIYSWKQEVINAFDELQSFVLVENFNGKTIAVTRTCDGCLGEFQLSFNDKGRLVFFDGSNKFFTKDLVFITADSFGMKTYKIKFVYTCFIATYHCNMYM